MAQFQSASTVNHSDKRLKKMLIFIVLLIGVPLLELYFLIQVGFAIGVLPTIGLAIVTAVAGTVLVRQQGFSVLQRLQAALQRGELPAHDLLDGALLLIAGIFLLLPGFLTDASGFFLLLPPLRRWVIRRLFASRSGRQHPPSVAPAQIIEGEFRRDD
jgi:UPF0716 protein FxsA